MDYTTFNAIIIGIMIVITYYICSYIMFLNSRKRCDKYINNPNIGISWEDFKNLTMEERYKIVNNSGNYEGSFDEFIKDVKMSPLPYGTHYLNRLRCEYGGEEEYWIWYYHCVPGGGSLARRKLAEMGKSV